MEPDEAIDRVETLTRSSTAVLPDGWPQDLGRPVKKWSQISDCSEVQSTDAHHESLG